MELTQLFYNIHALVMGDGLREKQLAIHVNLSAAATYITVKAKSQQIFRDDHAGAAGIDKAQMTILSGLGNGLGSAFGNGTGRCCDESAVNIKKQDFSIHRLPHYPDILCLQKDCPYVRRCH